MKTLTKILSVTALIVLCVCLFTLTAFAAVGSPVVLHEEYDAPSCTSSGHIEYWKSLDGDFYNADPTNGTDPEVISDANKVGNTWSSVNLDPVAHTLVYHGPTVMNCGKGIDGNNEYYQCQVCHKYFDDENASNEWDYNTDILIAAKHTVDDPETPDKPANKPDCMSAGNIDYYICTVCKKPCNANGTITYTKSDVSLPANPALHQWTDWEVLKPQTNVSPGQKMRECQICGEKEYEEIRADGIDKAPYTDLWYVVPLHDTWLRGEEALTFDSNLVEKLNRESGPNANYVGVRVGTDSLYENSYDTFDFWSWDRYIKLGDKTMQGLREGQYRIWVYDRRNPKEYTTSCEFWVVDVPTLEPYSTDKHVVNSSKSLRFVASEEIQPNSVQVGSRKLYDSNDYFVSNDRKNITLSPDFLNARQTGTYTISALTKDGRTIKTNFYILSTAQASSSPRTGDESQIGLWAAFLLLSGAAIVVMVPKLRKHGAK